jgi:hypothetical protein
MAAQSDQETLSVRRFRRPSCEHEHVVEVRTTGLLRMICEDCGHISFRFFEVPADAAELLSVGPKPD